MMQHVTFRMKRGTALVTLADILALVSPGNSVWKLLEFLGVGVAPRGMSMPDFETRVRSDGYTMSWDELRQFAGGLEQVWDCLIVALRPGDGRSREELLRRNCADAELVIEGLDSTTWSVRSNDAIWLRRVENTLGGDSDRAPSD